MFWLGIILALLGGIISTESSRKWLSNKLPKVTSRRLDITSICCIILGLGISSYLYYVDLKIQNEQIEYSDIVQFNWHGYTTSDPRGGGFGTPFSGWTEDPITDRRCVHMVYDSDSHRYTHFSWICDQMALDHYKKVIEECPRFPFPYAVMALCMKEKGMDGWKAIAIEGKAIFDKTATIPGPHVRNYKHFKKLLNDALTSEN